MKIWTKEVKIAITAIVALICVFVGINFLKGINIFESKNTYYVKFRDCAGLQVTNAVYANGFPVGIVRDINYNYSDNDGVVATIELDKDMRLPKGSTAELVSGLMGGVTMNLVMGPNPTQFIETHDTITGGPQAGALDMAAEMIPDIQKLLPKLDSILANLNALTGSPALNASLNNFQAITTDLRQTSAALPGTMQQIDGMAAHFNSVSGKVDALDFNATLKSVDSTLNAAHSLMTRLDGVSQNLNGMTQTLNGKLNSKDNSLGLLLNDTRMHSDINHTIQSADSLLSDIKAHPKRYINISVFGGKSK